MLTQAQLEAILGRPLTPREVTNLTQYLKTAQTSLETLICSPLDEDVGGVRYFNTRDGYRTVFTDIFTDIVSVKVNGSIIDPSEYYVAYFDRRNSPIYSSIVFKNRNYTNCTQEIEIEANWGVKQQDMPSDMQTLLALLFALTSKPKSVSGQVRNKKNEDFTISFTDSSVEETFKSNNADAINKYSLCNIGYIRHGNVRRIPLSQRDNVRSAVRARWT